jgi:CTP:molybdopterin cytidylyltransferase MocA
MGTPKALLPIGGETAVARAAWTLARGGCGPVVVVLGSEAERVATLGGIPTWTRTVVHEGWQAGRSGSLKAGIGAVPEAAAWVVLPVDHPLVQGEDVGALVRAWRAEWPAVVRPVRDGKGGHPILLDAALKPELLDLGDDEPLRDLVHRHADREVTVPGSPGTLVDVNTPEDYERFVNPRPREP